MGGTNCAEQQNGRENDSANEGKRTTRIIDGNRRSNVQPAQSRLPPVPFVAAWRQRESGAPAQATYRHHHGTPHQSARRLRMGGRKSTMQRASPEPASAARRAGIPVADGQAPLSFTRHTRFMDGESEERGSQSTRCWYGASSLLPARRSWQDGLGRQSLHCDPSPRRLPPVVRHGAQQPSAPGS